MTPIVLSCAGVITMVVALRRPAPAVPPAVTGARLTVTVLAIFAAFGAWCGWVSP